MTDHALVTRRVLLKDMGKAGLAVLVLGSAACTAESGQTTVAGNETTTSVRPPAILGIDDQPYDWHRVDLDFVSAYILYRNGAATIVDTGVEGSESSIEAALSEIGVGWEDIGTVIVTHKHSDHQGSIEAVLERTPQAVVVAGSADVSSITTQRDIVPMFDGQNINDLEIIETPGHTPGHISVLDPVAGILVAGDALNGAEGGVDGPNADFSEDMGAANASVAKLAGFDYEVALFGHGDPVLSGASGLVVELADSLADG